MTTFYCDKCGGYIGGDLPDFTHFFVCTCDIEKNLPSPQKQPFRCPVCNGSGTVSYEGHYYTSTTFGGFICHSCNGTGIVWG